MAFIKFLSLTATFKSNSSIGDIILGFKRLQNISMCVRHQIHSNALIINMCVAIQAIFYKIFYTYGHNTRTSIEYRSWIH